MLDLLTTQFRFLAFRPIKPDLRNHWFRYVSYVIIVTWLVGMGRYWDHPKALPWQYLGLGSVAYLFVLSTFLFVVVAPLRPLNWNWLNVFVFVGLTSLPAGLYAIPVERFMNIQSAMSLNALFLALIALWRVSLYATFLTRYARLGGGQVLLALLLPLSAIVVALSALNLEHVVFNIMAGNRDNVSSSDLSYFVVILISWFAVLLSPATLIGYLFAIWHAWTSKTGNPEPKSGDNEMSV